MNRRLNYTHDRNKHFDHNQRWQPNHRIVFLIANEVEEAAVAVTLASWVGDNGMFSSSTNTTVAAVVFVEGWRR